LFGCSAPHIRSSASAEPSGDPRAHLYDALCLRPCERLGIGVGDDKINALQPRRDHVVDRIPPGATDTKYRNASLHLANIGNVSHVRFKSLEWKSSNKVVAYCLTVGLLHYGGEMPTAATNVLYAGCSVAIAKTRPLVPQSKTAATASSLNESPTNH